MTIDEIIEKQRRNLTKAQIAALQEAANRYNIQNAGKRSEAYAQSQEQYDKGVRTLQNMGLAGRQGTQLSGEVPRLDREIRTGFEGYNQALRNVENQRLEGLGESFAQQTRRARAAAAQAHSSTTPTWQEFTGAVGPVVANQQGDMQAKTQQMKNLAAAITLGWDTVKKPSGSVSDFRQYEQQAADTPAQRAVDEARANYEAAKQTGSKAMEAATKRVYDQKLQQASTAQGAGQDLELRRAYLTLASPNTTNEQKAEAWKPIAGSVLNDMFPGLREPGMTGDEFESHKEQVPGIRALLETIENPNSAEIDGGQVQDAIKRLSNEYGLTTKQARDLIDRYDSNRTAASSGWYEYRDALAAIMRTNGATPKKEVNKDEKDFIYRAVNGLHISTKDLGFGLSSAKVQDAELWVNMTEDQKNAYNALYETDGIEAANKYANDIVPFINLYRAEKDQKWAKEFAEKNTWNAVPMFLLGRAAFFGGVPQMLERTAYQAINAVSDFATGGTNIPLHYDYNSPTSRSGNWGRNIDSAAVQAIESDIDLQSHPTLRKLFVDAYQQFSSNADSINAMLLNKVLPGSADLLFFSRAGNEAYVEAVENGATQEQAMNRALLFGAAETIFEKASLEYFSNLFFSNSSWFNGIKKEWLKNLIAVSVGGPVEGSEEFFTELANIISDNLVFKDESEFNRALASYDGDRKKAWMKMVDDKLWPAFAQGTIGGWLMGGEGLAGWGAVKGANALINYHYLNTLQRASQKELNRAGQAILDNKAIREVTVAQSAILGAGEEVRSFLGKQNVEQAANLVKAREDALSVLPVTDNEQRNAEIRAATTLLLGGELLDDEQAKFVYDTIGKQALERFGYNAENSTAFQKSYKARLGSFGIRGYFTKDLKAQYETERNAASDKAAAERVYKDPNVGLPITTDDGKKVTPLPGNITAVTPEQQRRDNYKARTTAKKGRVQYAFSGMEARAGLNDEQKIAAIKKNMEQSALNKCEFWESLSRALGIDFVIHDHMNGENGYYDRDTNAIHVSLDSKQSVLRVTAHEMTHLMKQASQEGYLALRDALVEAVGKETWEQRIKQKADEYTRAGQTIDISTEKGRALAEEETVAEYSERMLSDSDFVEQFVEDHTEAAKTLRGIIQRIVNAINKAFKRWENRYYGKSWANELAEMKEENKVVEAWYSLLDKTIQKQEAGPQIRGTVQAQGRRAQTESVQEQQGEQAPAEQAPAQEQAAEQAQEQPTAEQAQEQETKEAPAAQEEEKQQETEEKSSVQEKKSSVGEAMPFSLDTDAMRSGILADSFSLDADYMRLAEKYKAGTLTKEDEGKLRKMVDEAARANGYTRRVYHGTPLETTSASRGRLTGKEYDKLATDYADKILPFTVFKSWVPGRRGTYTSTNRQVAEDFAVSFTHGTTVFDLYAKTDRPLVLDAHDSSWINLPHDVLKQAGVPITDNWGNGTVRIDDVVVYAHANGYDSLVVNNVRELGEGDSYLSPLTNDVIVFTPEQLKSADPIVYDDEGNIIPLSERFKQDNDDIRYTFDTDAMRSGIREAFTQINGDNLHEAIDLMDNVQSVRAWAFKDVSRMMDALAGSNKDLRNTLNTIFEEPHSRATGNYANGIANLNRQLLDIGKRAGVFDEKGKNFDEKKSAAIQEIGEGFSNKHTHAVLYVVDENTVHLKATDTAGKVISDGDFTRQQLRDAYGRESAEAMWSAVYGDIDKAKRKMDKARRQWGATKTDMANGKATQEAVDKARKEYDKLKKKYEDLLSGKDNAETDVNTQPYTLDDLKAEYPNDWEKLQQAALEFRQIYENYIRKMNQMLAIIYPHAVSYNAVEDMQKAIDKLEGRLRRREDESAKRVKYLQKQLADTERSIANKEKKGAAAKKLTELKNELRSLESEMLNKKRTDTKVYGELYDKAERLRKRIETIENETDRQLRRRAIVLRDQIAETKAEFAEYRANAKERLDMMTVQREALEKGAESGESLNRMHRLEYRKDYFHHFREMEGGLQNLKSIFNSNTDISPAIAGKSDTTKPKTRWAGIFQKRTGGEYTPNAFEGMQRYGQLAEYKLAFDPLVAYLREGIESIRKINDNTNRNDFIRYLENWTNTLAGKSHAVDRSANDSGIVTRKALALLDWINGRVIKNTLLYNVRSAAFQASNLTNAVTYVQNPADWTRGVALWHKAQTDEFLQSEMAKSNFLASRYMDNLFLDSGFYKTAERFGTQMLGALDELSCKATWWAAYSQYMRNPDSAFIKSLSRDYESAIDYADDICRRTHAGRGVGELAPIMTSRVVNFFAPFQVEVNNTYQLLKDNVKRRNFLGLVNMQVSVFLFNSICEATIGTTPLGFDFIRAIIDIVLGFVDDDDDEEEIVGKKLYGSVQRLAGEFVGGLPYAAQVVAILGEDTAKKIIGSESDATRYGASQIGFKSFMDIASGAYDIIKAYADGGRPDYLTWVDELGSVFNLLLPFGGNQLTRTFEGVATVARGYSGKYSDGEEKVQFAVDKTPLEMFHAALFGKYSLIGNSQYRKEKRLIPLLLGDYKVQDYSTGKLESAKEYKAALDIGLTGKGYFALKNDMGKFKTQDGKRQVIMSQSYTPEQKAKLDELLVVKDSQTKITDGLLYTRSENSTSEKDWELKADYNTQDMFDLSMMGQKTYLAANDLIKGGYTTARVMQGARLWNETKDTPDELEGVDDRKIAYKRLLFAQKGLTPEQKQDLDMAFTGNKTAADYTNEEIFELSLKVKNNRLKKAQAAQDADIDLDTFTALYDKREAYDGDEKAMYTRQLIMGSNLTVEQKEVMDDLLVSDDGRNPDYRSKAWFELSTTVSEESYNQAIDAQKRGISPELYLQIYNKVKTLDAKDENGKSKNGLKKKRVMDYLKSIGLSNELQDYVWENKSRFGY